MRKHMQSNNFFIYTMGRLYAGPAHEKDLEI